MYSSGVIPWAAALAAITLLRLFPLPFCRPPRRSPGFDPLGICYPLLKFRYFYPVLIGLRGLVCPRVHLIQPLLDRPGTDAGQRQRHREPSELLRL